MIYFTSDTHFGHANIIKYCDRPFATVEEMNEALVKNWNSRVSPSDTVYHLGDFAMGGKDNLNIRSRLQGKIVLIRGNHDRSCEQMAPYGFSEIYDNLKLEVDGVKLYLAHIAHHIADPYAGRNTTEKILPELLVPPPIDFDYFLCGHVHEKWTRHFNTINVGVDVCNFHPMTLAEVLKRDD